MDHDAVKQELIESDEAFRALYEEHQECEGKLDALHEKDSLSIEDEIEAKRIKIHKLALKDQMEHLIREHSESVSATA